MKVISVVCGLFEGDKLVLDILYDYKVIQSDHLVDESQFTVHRGPTHETVQIPQLTSYKVKVIAVVSCLSEGDKLVLDILQIIQ